MRLICRRQKSCRLRLFYCNNCTLGVRENKRRQRHRDKVAQEHKSWTLPQAAQDKIDARVAATHAVRPGYVRSTLRPFHLRGSIKGADCLRMMTEAGMYWFHNMLPPPQQATWDIGVRMMTALHNATCDVDDPTAVDVLRALKLKTTRALVKWAKSMPGTEHAVIIHEIVHMCDHLYRWNRVRNYWCFVTERSYPTARLYYLFIATSVSSRLICRDFLYYCCDFLYYCRDFLY
jgi:hypothetical protein